MKSSSRIPGRASYVLLLFVSLSAFAADWNRPATDLAKQIASASGPGTITVTVTNSSSLPKDEVALIQHAIETQLRSSGIRVGAAANANSDVHITLSENLQGLLWVAEVKQGNQVQVAMVTVPRASGAAPTKSGPAVLIHKALMWSQETPILDAVVLDASTPNARMMILDTGAITSYAIANGRWEKQQSWNLTVDHVLPRDLRGLLVANQNKTIDTYFPGTVCNLNAPSSIACHDGDDPWKIGLRAAFFNSGRNYFTGALVPASDKPVAPFYSAAWIERPGYALAIFSSLDGRVRVSDGVNERTVSANLTSDWGSDLVAVKSGCASGSQLLVTSAGDDTSTDSLRAFDIPDREPVLVSAPLDFPGPITALWSHDSSSAMAIAHNLHTGQYEAYSVSITCNQ